MSRSCLKELSYEECCDWLSDTSAVKNASDKGCKIEHTFNSLGLGKVLSNKSLMKYRCKLRRHKDLHLRTVTKVLMAKEARRLGSLNKVRSVSIPIVLGNKRSKTNIHDLVSIRKGSMKSIDMCKKIGVTHNNINYLEKRMTSNVDNDGLFNVYLSTIFKYAKALNVETLVIPIKNEDGKHLEFLYRKKESL